MSKSKWIRFAENTPVRPNRSVTPGSDAGFPSRSIGAMIMTRLCIYYTCIEFPSSGFPARFRRAVCRPHGARQGTSCRPNGAPPCQGAPYQPGAQPWVPRSPPEISALKGRYRGRGAAPAGGRSCSILCPRCGALSGRGLVAGCRFPGVPAGTPGFICGAAVQRRCFAALVGKSGRDESDIARGVSNVYGDLQKQCLAEKNAVILRRGGALPKSLYGGVHCAPEQRDSSLRRSANSE